MDPRDLGYPRSDWRQLFAPVRLADLTLLLLLALVVLTGALTAFGVRLFERAVSALFDFGYTVLPGWLRAAGLPTWLAFLLFPAALGFVHAAVVRLVPPGDRHHAIPLVILSRVRRDGRIRPGTTLLKSLAAILTLGAGGSLGREGPVVLLGAGIGSALGQATRVRASWRNALVTAGAAAAIATAFHAPIAGSFFAMEIVLAPFTARSFALAALSATVAALLSNAMTGQPAFPIPAYAVLDPVQIPLFLGLGLCIAPLSRLYIAAIWGGEEVGRKLGFFPGPWLSRVARGFPGEWLPPALRCALGGVLFGLVGLALPETLGPGIRTIQDALEGRLPLLTLAALLGGKLVAIACTSGGGWTGGTFTPALFLGAMGGGLYGHLAALALPGVAVQPGAYAVVGMAAMIAGATQAPLTALALIFEITRDYRIALSAMVACGVAAVFSQRINPFSVDTLHLPEQGILLPWQLHDLREVKVGEAMAHRVDVVRSDMDLRAVIDLMHQTRHGGYPVVDAAGRLVGMITLKDVRDVPLEGRLATPVTRAMSKNLITVTPDQTVAEAALLMARHDVGRLPVVAADDPTRLVGILSRTDILRAYPTLKREFGSE